MWNKINGSCNNYFVLFRLRGRPRVWNKINVAKTINLFYFMLDSRIALHKESRETLDSEDAGLLQFTSMLWLPETKPRRIGLCCHWKQNWIKSAHTKSEVHFFIFCNYCTHNKLTLFRLRHKALHKSVLTDWLKCIGPGFWAFLYIDALL